VDGTLALTLGGLGALVLYRKKRNRQFSPLLGKKEVKRGDEPW
jgi:hypothetical protein